MILNIAAHLDYHFALPTDVLLQFEAAAQADQIVLDTRLEMSPTEHFVRIAAGDGIGERIWIRADGQLTCDYRAKVRVDRIVREIAGLGQTPVHLLPAEMVKYLMSSRYCPADEFQNFAGAEFGDLTGGARIAAVRDWIEENFEYLPGVSNAQTTAFDTFALRQGICRDFAHVLITLARASAVPARMASVYALGIVPEDFHAVAEVYLDGEWHLVDPTGMASAETMVRIGVGRDAADVAFMTSYGNAAMNRLSVHVEELIPD